MDDRTFYGQDSQEIKTSQNLETIERLFDEWDEEDKTSQDSFTLDGQNASYSDNFNIKEAFTENNTTNASQTSSHSEADLFNTTQNINNVDLNTLKEVQAELHKLAGDQQETEETQQETEETLNNGQSNGRTLTKSTPTGRAFAISNGNLTKTFMECAVLCFVTASIGLGFLLNLLYHI